MKTLKSKEKSLAKKRGIDNGQSKESERRRSTRKDVPEKENLTKQTRRSPTKTNKLDITVSDTTSSSESVLESENEEIDDIGSSIGSFEEEDEEESESEGNKLTRRSNKSLKKYRVVSSDEGSISGSSRSTEGDDDDDDIRNVEKAPVLNLRSTVLVPVEDIGDLLQSYLKENLTRDWSFSIKRSIVTRNGQPASSTESLNSDRQDSDFSPSASSLSDSDDSSSSGSMLSWESECESISSSNSWLPRKKRKDSDDESDSKSDDDELEELDDDFILHTTKRALRKRKYALRGRNGKVARNTSEESGEGSTYSSEDESG